MKHSIIISNKIVGLIAAIILSTFMISCGSEKDDFEMPSEDVLKRVAAATEVAGHFFSECNSISELEKHLDEIGNTEGVVDVWTDDQTMYIYIEDWGVISYYYPFIPNVENISLTRLEEENKNDEVITNMGSSTTRADTNIEIAKTHFRLNDLDKHSFVIYNGVFIENSPYFENCSEIAIRIMEEFKSMGFTTNIFQDTSKSSVNFFINELPQYDIVYILAHGDYDEKYSRHSLLTSERVKIGEELTDEEIASFIKEKKYEKYFIGQPISEKMDEEQKERIRQENEKNRLMNFVCLRKRDANGVITPTYYVKLYEKFLSTYMSPFKSKSIVFSAACKSMEGTPSLAEIFCQKGAACYLGYDEKTSVGPFESEDFFKGLLNGLSAHTSYKKLDKSGKDVFLDRSNLIFHAQDNNEENKHVCIVHPDIVSYEEDSYSVLLKGSIKIADPNNDNEYGFALRKKDSKYVNPIKPGIKYNDGNTEKSQCTYNSKDSILTFECTVSKSEFKDVDQFCAYLYDGERYCLGDLEDIEIKEGSSCPDDNHPHAIDLGLPSGNKWSCCLLGESEPSTSNQKYPWGYTTPVDDNYIINYMGPDVYYGYKYGKRVTYYQGTYHCEDDCFVFLGDDISGTQYDAVYVSKDWGEGWVMPNLNDFQELVNNCAFEGSGLHKKIIGPNGNYIDAGPFDAWSSTLGPINSEFPKPYMCAYLFSPYEGKIMLDLRNEAFEIWPVFKKPSGK